MWELNFEFSEDYRHKSTVGDVPPKALEWLEDKWELLPRDGWQHNGSLKGETGKPAAVLLETMKLVVNNDHDERCVTRSSEWTEEVNL